MFGFETVETIRKGKPVVPKEPKDAETRVTSYYLRFTESGKRIVEPARSNFLDAVTALRNKELQREYTARGVDAPETMTSDSRLTLAGAAAQFIKNQKALDKSDATIYGYTRAVEHFRASCHKVYHGGN